MQWTYDTKAKFMRWTAKSVLPNPHGRELFMEWCISVTESGAFTLLGTNPMLTRAGGIEFASFLLAKTFCELKNKMLISLLENDGSFIGERLNYGDQEVKDEDHVVERVLEEAIKDRKLQLSNEGLEINVDVQAEHVENSEDSGVFVAVENSDSFAEALKQSDEICDAFGLDKEKIRDNMVNSILNRMADIGVKLGDLDFGVFCVVTTNVETGDVKYVSNLTSVPKVGKLLDAVAKNINSMASEMN